MSNKPVTPAASPEPTDARFTLRAMLFATAVVAILAALLGPVVRQLGPDEQVRLLIAWGLWLVVFMLWNGYQATERRRAEKLAGRTLLRLPMFDERVPHASQGRRNLNAALWGVLGLIFLQGLSFQAVEFAFGGNVFLTVLQFGAMSVMSVWAISHGVAMLWWRNNVRFCELGVLWDRQVILWTHVIGYRWNRSDLKLLELEGIDHRNVDLKISVVVPLQQRNVLEDLMRERIESSKSTLLAHQLSIADNEQRLGQQHNIRIDYALAMSFCIGCIALYFWWIRPELSFAVTPFEQGVIASLLMPFLLGLMGKRLGHSAGGFVARLRTSLPLLRIAAGVVYIVAFCFIAPLLAMANEWLLRVIGFVSASIASGTMTSILLRTIDLRERGIMGQRILFWPWQDVTFEWSRDTGRLVLGRRGRRVVAAVLPEQREAVEAVLREKLGAGPEAAAEVMQSNG